MQLDGTLVSLHGYLKQLESCHASHQSCKERLVLQHGRVFEPATLTTHERELLDNRAELLAPSLHGFDRKQCFSNSQLLVSAGPDGPLVYCEGYCYPRGGLPVHHAWVTVNGKVIDVTWRDRATGEPTFGLFTERHYFGVSFETRFVRSEMLRTTSASTLLDEAIGLDVDARGQVSRVRREIRGG